MKNLVVGFVVLSAVFLVVERVFGGRRGKPLLRRGGLLDAGYWLFTPLVTRALTRTALVLPAAVLVAIGVVSVSDLKAGAYDGFGPLSVQPQWLQAIEMLIIADLVAYWTHRLFHRGRWWPFHAVHHSSEDLDWLSSVRLHPVNDVVTKTAQVLPLLLLGFHPFAATGVAGFFSLYAIFIHADVSWDFGPLRYAIATPAFHRWHHAKDAEAVDKNFAGLLPLWDVLFGTLYLPRDRAPRSFGIHEPMPAHLPGQIVKPFTDLFRDRPRPATLPA